MMDRMSSSYCKRNRAETINEARTARRLVLARLTVEGTMGQGESQIGYISSVPTFPCWWDGQEHDRQGQGIGAIEELYL